MKKELLAAALIVLTTVGCRDDKIKQDVVVKEDVITTENPQDDNHDLNHKLSDGEKKSNVELIAIGEMNPLAGANLKLLSPMNGAKLDSGEIAFDYEVDNFNLGDPTVVKTDYELAESEKGQHIHAILNNEPYMAHYEPRFSKELGEGQYILMSFLSRSYHLSLKEMENYEVVQFTVGDPEMEPYDLSQPYLFYSRPKGTYNINENSDILLDFYLHNCVLSETGFKVKAKIAGYDFLIESWQPYAIRGLRPGMHAITLELVDGNGTTVNSPFNPVSRNFQVVSELN
jgi:hypothetical protein